jgi:hypothetical protein
VSPVLRNENIERAVIGTTGIIAVASGAIAVTSPDHTGPWLAFAGALIVAVVTAVTTERRQRATLTAEEERLQLQLEHERERLELQLVHGPRVAERIQGADRAQRGGWMVHAATLVAKWRCSSLA